MWQTQDFGYFKRNFHSTRNTCREPRWERCQYCQKFGHDILQLSSFAVTRPSPHWLFARISSLQHGPHVDMSCAALSALSAPGIALIEPRCNIFQETLRTLRALDPCRRVVLTFMSLCFVRFGSRSLWRRVDCDVCYTTPLLTLCMRLRECVHVGPLSVLIATSVAQDALRGLCFMILRRLL